MEVAVRRNDLDYSDEIIKETINNDVLGRKQKLISFIKLLNAVEDNFVISVDGSWGCGKTFFVKQILYIHKNNDVFVGDDNSCNDIIEEFKQKYIPIYYNAWEHDDDCDPLGSIICQLVSDESNDIFSREKIKEKCGKAAIDLITDFAFEYLDNKTNGILTRIKKSVSKNNVEYDVYIEEIKRHNKKKEVLDDLFNKMLGDNQRLLFVIDDVDRSRPDYSIKLLEVIKHFYSNKHITVIITTNNKQLANSVEAIYGNKTDGYKYLNRIFDFTLYLNTDNMEEYLKQYYGILFGEKLALEQLVVTLCKYLNFSYRDANRFILMYKIVENYTKIGDYFIDSNDKLLVSSVLAYGLAFKVNDVSKYEAILNGDLEKSGFRDFLRHLAKQEDFFGLFNWMFGLAINNNNYKAKGGVTDDDMIDTILARISELVGKKQHFVYDLKEALSLLGSNSVYTTNFGSVGNSKK